MSFTPWRVKWRAPKENSPRWGTNAVGRYTRATGPPAKAKRKKRAKKHGDGADASPDLRDLVLIDVDAPHVMPVYGQASGSHRADVAETDYCNLHRITHLLGLLTLGYPAYIRTTSAAM